MIALNPVLHFYSCKKQNFYVEICQVFFNFRPNHIIPNHVRQNWYYTKLALDKITLYQIMLYQITFGRFIRNHVIPNHVIPNHVIPNHVIPNHVIPNHVIPNHVIRKNVVPNWLDVHPFTVKEAKFENKSCLLGSFLYWAFINDPKFWTLGEPRILLVWYNFTVKVAKYGNSLTTYMYCLLG
jgi:hypothetical protein